MTRAIVRRGVASLALAGCLACASPPSQSAYLGVSAGLSTGSESISGVGLVAAYDMETTTTDGRLRDFSGGGHHGAMSTADLVQGVVGQARRYDGVDDKVFLSATDAFDLDGPHTIAAWVRVDTLGLHQHVVACDDKWALWITPDDQWRLGDTQGGGWSSDIGTVKRGQWTSVVSVLTGTKGDSLTPESVALYVDGRLASASEHLRTGGAREQGVWNPGVLHPSDACYIGYESHQGIESHRTLPFVGAIDEVLVFSRAWTDDEVRAFAARKVSK